MLPEQFANEVTKLAEDAASLHAGAAQSAATIVLLEILNLLVAKGVVSKEEIRARLDNADRRAADVKDHAPVLVDHVTQMTVVLRHALGTELKTMN